MAKHEMSVSKQMNDVLSGIRLIEKTIEARRDYVGPIAPVASNDGYLK